MVKLDNNWIYSRSRMCSIVDWCLLIFCEFLFSVVIGCVCIFTCLFLEGFVIFLAVVFFLFNQNVLEKGGGMMVGVSIRW